MPPHKPVLVTGATGYVGGRLVPRLLDAGYRVRVLARSPLKLQGRAWAGHPLMELAAGDLLDYDSLLQAARGCRAAYYLVHSMGAAGDFPEKDRQAASNMAAAAAGLELIIYLGGLGSSTDSHLSEHLRSTWWYTLLVQPSSFPPMGLSGPAASLGRGGRQTCHLRSAALHPGLAPERRLLESIGLRKNFPSLIILKTT